MKLFFRKKGKGIPLIILHGLWGSSDNWLQVASLLSRDFRVIMPDLRNHGHSPHSPEMDYEVMSNDIISFIRELELPVRPYIVGHSMGGKVVMALLLKQPELVEKAVIVDIAPISYSLTDGGRHSFIIDFMAAFDPSRFKTRKELTAAIGEHFRSERSRQLFLKNIRKTPEGFEWKVNFPVLSRHFDKISGCPEKLPFNRYENEILFIKGEQSDLIPGIDCLQKEFPAARLTLIKHCGHWVHSEQPEELAQTIREFILPKQTTY